MASVVGKHRLTSVTGLAALGLDALASCAYGPEAIVLALAVAGVAGIQLTFGVTLMIVALLLVLVLCYRQVIMAYPDGGGAYTVSRRNLGQRYGFVAAASLVVDYILNVAVSVAAGVAALTSAFPGLLPWTVPLCLAVLAVVMGVNLRGLVTGARLFAFPAALFVALLVIVITVGMLRGEPNPLPAPTQAEVTSSVGILLILAAFANGCASLTGIEAIANATPSFRVPSAQRAARAELGLGVVLGALLLGLAALIERFDLQPVEGRTVLSLLTEGAIGTGAGYLLVQLTTVLLLALAANTSYGGLPVLAARLAADNALPHVFGLRADRLVYRQGIIVLSVLAGLLLLATSGQTSILVPLFAIGVFIGFSLCQAGMVLHWLRERGPGWRWRLALNGAGAVLTTVAAVVVTTEKFFAGAWLIVLVVPLLSLMFISVRRAYDRIGTVLEVDREELPRSFPGDAVVVVPVVSITRLAEETLSAALSLSDNVTAVHVVFTDDEQDTADAARDKLFAERFRRWQPNIPLVMLDSPHREIGQPIARYVKTIEADYVMVLIGEVEPDHWWGRVLFNRRGAVVARHVGQHTDAVVGRLRFRLHPRSERKRVRRRRLSISSPR